MSKTKTRRRRGDRAASRKRGGGLMLGMRSGFKGMAQAVAGEETRGSSRWTGRIITLLLLAAAVGLLLLSRL
ncbi:MAG TPA: hypothetical protein VNM90_18130 [Haliangium sp.]|nr:hypothetical protein [Haliangium sp.]